MKRTNPVLWLTANLVWEYLWFQVGQVIPAKVARHEGAFTWVRFAPCWLARIPSVPERRGQWIWLRVLSCDLALRTVRFERWTPHGDWIVSAVEGRRVTLLATDGASVTVKWPQRRAQAERGDRVDIGVARVTYYREGPEILVWLRGESRRQVLRIPQDGPDTSRRRA